MVSIHGPLGYGPSTLPLRHSAIFNMGVPPDCEKHRSNKIWRKNTKVVVRSGIRTHAYRSRLRPERSALDHSAILTVGLAQFSSFRCISFGFLLKREMTILHVVWNTKCSLSSIETCTLLFVVRVWLLITELWLKWLQFSVGWWYFLRTWLLP